MTPYIQYQVLYSYRRTFPCAGPTCCRVRPDCYRCEKGRDALLRVRGVLWNSIELVFSFVVCLILIRGGFHRIDTNILLVIWDLSNWDISMLNREPQIGNPIALGESLGEMWGNQMSLILNSMPLPIESPDCVFFNILQGISSSKAQTINPFGFCDLWNWVVIFGLLTISKIRGGFHRIDIALIAGPLSRDVSTGERASNWQPYPVRWVL